MKFISRTTNAREAASRWHEEYSGGTSWQQSEKRAIWVQLLALKDPTPEQVDTVIGNTSWTDVRCDECKRHVEVAVRLGDEPDYDSATATICLDCLHKALELGQ